MTETETATETETETETATATATGLAVSFVLPAVRTYVTYAGPLHSTCLDGHHITSLELCYPVPTQRPLALPPLPPSPLSQPPPSSPTHVMF